MVEAAGGGHDCGDGECVIDNIGPLFACADRHDHCLWRVDDGFELLDAHHAHVGDGRGAALIFMGLQLAFLCTRRKLGNFGRDFRQRLVRCVGDDGRNQAGGHRYRNADVGAAILQHIVASEADIAFGHLNKRKAKRLYEHVVDRQFDTTWFQRGVEFAAQLEQSIEADIDREVDVWNLLLGLGQTARNGFAHVGEFDDLVRDVATIHRKP